MSASFPLRASRSDDLFFRSIVIASEAWRSHALAQRHEIAAVASLLATTSAATSTGIIKDYILIREEETVKAKFALLGTFP